MGLFFDHLWKGFFWPFSLKIRTPLLKKNREKGRERKKKKAPKKRSKTSIKIFEDIEQICSMYTVLWTSNKFVRSFFGFCLKFLPGSFFAFSAKTPAPVFEKNGKKSKKKTRKQLPKNNGRKSRGGRTNLTDSHGFCPNFFEFFFYKGEVFGSLTKAVFAKVGTYFVPTFLCAAAPRGDAQNITRRPRTPVESPKSYYAAAPPPDRR